jgi:hypothetical protein
MIHRAALVRTDVSEERIASIIRVTRIGELGTLALNRNRQFLSSVPKLVVTVNVPSSPILVTLMIEATCSSETPVLTRATWRNNLEGGILQLFAMSVPDMRFALKDGRPVFRSVAGPRTTPHRNKRPTLSFYILTCSVTSGKRHFTEEQACNSSPPLLQNMSWFAADAFDLFNSRKRDVTSQLSNHNLVHLMARIGKRLIPRKK